VEFPDLECAARWRGGRIDRAKVVRRTARRKDGAIQVRRQQATEVGAGRTEEDGGRALIGQHLVPIEGHRASANERSQVAAEEVDRHVVGVGPDGQLRVVREVGVADLPGVAEVRAGGIPGCRHGEALVVGRNREATLGGEGELGEDPAVRHPVVADDGIALVGELAEAAEAGPQGVTGAWTHKRRAGPVKDLEVEVHPLDVVVRADVAVRVRGENVVDVVDALEGAGRRHGGGPDGRLDRFRRRRDSGARLPGVQRAVRLVALAARRDGAGVHRPQGGRGVGLERLDDDRGAGADGEGR